MRRAARAVLVAAVRGRHDRGGPWGEAALAELDQTTGRWEAVRWAAGGLLAAWHERRARIRTMPIQVRIRRAFAVSALIALPAAVVVNQFVLTPRYIPSGSMEPTMQINDRILIDKVSFRLTGIDRGDIVEFSHPDLPGAHLIKRVIGLPGDTIECRGDKVYRDGDPVDEPYLSADDPQTLDCGAPVTVPPDRLFVLGDHRMLSQDSRRWGPIPQSSVDGRLLMTVWPPR